MNTLSPIHAALETIIRRLEALKHRMPFWSDRDAETYAPNQMADKCIAVVREELSKQPGDAPVQTVNTSPGHVQKAPVNELAASEIRYNDAAEQELRLILSDTLKEIILGNEYPNAIVTKLRPYLRAQPAPVSHPVFAFLLGEGALEGRWFGDESPKTAAGYKAPYWWRKHLRAALEGNSHVD